MSRISVVIATCNRREDLLVAVASCLAQVPMPEVLVYDDASTDGTAEAVRQDFPDVRVIRREQRTGYIVNRNAGFRDATGEFVVSIDDDAYFTATGTLARVVELFDAYPQAAAFALPYVEPRAGADRALMTPQPLGTPLRNYIGCSHALRRQVVLDLGGYPECLVHQGEERDLSIRLLDQGHEVLFADTPPIVHLFSPKRDVNKIDYYGYRNTLLFSAMRLPFPICCWRIFVDAAKLLKHKFSLSTITARVVALAAGVRDSIRYWRQRGPVRLATFHHYEKLPRHGPLPITANMSLDPLRPSNPRSTY